MRRVILLDDVVQELHLSQFGKSQEFSMLLHSLRRNGVSCILVSRDAPCCVEELVGNRQ
jgi:hypothetical protein